MPVHRRSEFATDQNGVDCLILFLTAKTLEEDILFGFGYRGAMIITKPFRIQELCARVAHIYAEKKGASQHTSFEPDIRFDLPQRYCMFPEQPVPLTKASIQSVNTLRKTGDRFSKEQIYEAVFGLME